ncbi:hypothetical protein GCM10023317_30840 [Actinopolymorpha pittospori]
MNPPNIKMTRRPINARGSPHVKPLARSRFVLSLMVPPRSPTRVKVFRRDASYRLIILGGANKGGPQMRRFLIPPPQSVRSDTLNFAISSGEMAGKRAAAKTMKSTKATESMEFGHDYRPTKLPHVPAVRDWSGGHPRRIAPPAQNICPILQRTPSARVDPPGTRSRPTRGTIPWTPRYQ